MLRHQDLSWNISLQGRISERSPPKNKQGHREDNPVMLDLLMSPAVQADLPTGTLDLPHCQASADSPASSWLQNKRTEPGSNGHQKTLNGDARRTEDPQGTCLETRGSLTQEVYRSHVVL